MDGDDSGGEFVALCSMKAALIRLFQCTRLGCLVRVNTLVSDPGIGGVITSTPLQPGAERGRLVVGLLSNASNLVYIRFPTGITFTSGTSCRAACNCGLQIRTCWLDGQSANVVQSECSPDTWLTAARTAAWCRWTRTHADNVFVQDLSGTRQSWVPGAIPV